MYKFYILDEVMLKAIAEPRENISEYAPKIINMAIPVDKIREVRLGYFFKSDQFG